MIRQTPQQLLQVPLPMSNVHSIRIREEDCWYPTVMLTQRRSWMVAKIPYIGAVLISRNIAVNRAWRLSAKNWLQLRQNTHIHQGSLRHLVQRCGQTTCIRNCFNKNFSKSKQFFLSFNSYRCRLSEVAEKNIYASLQSLLSRTKSNS